MFTGWPPTFSFVLKLIYSLINHCEWNCENKHVEIKMKFLRKDWYILAVRISFKITIKKWLWIKKKKLSSANYKSKRYLWIAVVEFTSRILKETWSPAVCDACSSPIGCLFFVPNSYNWNSHPQIKNVEDLYN